MPQTSHRPWRNSVLACALLAAALPLLARVVAGPPGADVQVEWKPSVDAATRAQLEVQLRLADPRKLDDTYTWRYDIIDPSTDNIRALVTHAAVEDTHEIERNTFTLEPTAPRTSRRQRFASGDAIVGTGDGVAVVLLLLAGVIAVTRRSPAALVQRAIPHVDARTAGLFRIVFGTCVLAFFASRPIDATWLNATFDLEIDGTVHRAVVDWLRDRPAVVNAITPWVLATGAAFTIGLFTRVSYALFVAGVILWAYVAISINSTHPHASLVLTLVALLPSKWGDALSADAWLRRTAPSPAGPAYGYGVWIPTVVFGVAFAAAAWAKLTVPPGLTDWVANGSVKYHFITDSVNAPVDWGLQLVRYPRLAIAASFGAIAIETLVITAAFVRSEVWRFAMGAGALSLLAGFRLFMGVFWPGWWIQLLGFLPWQRIGSLMNRTSATNAVRSVRLQSEVRSVRLQADLPGPAKAGHYVQMKATHALPAAQLALIAFVLSQQVVVSSVRLERAPMFSWYDMYSGTYANAEAWAASHPPVYRIVAHTDQGAVELAGCNPHGEFVRTFEQALDGMDEARASVWQDLRACGEASEQAASVTLEGDLRVFDWDTLQFVTTPNAVTVGPLVRRRDDRQDAR